MTSIIDQEGGLKISCHTKYKLYTFIILTASLPCLAAEPPGTKPGGVPQAPALMREVHEVDIERNADGSIKYQSPQYYRSIRPTIPPVRTSHDGRIGFNWTNRNIYLLAPEKITRPFPFSESGLAIIGDLNGFYSNIEDLLFKEGDQNRPGYFAGSVFCNSAPIAEQTKRCNGNNECYEMSYLSYRMMKSPNNPKNSFDHAFFRSRKVVIEVHNPKTVNARIVAVRGNGPVKEKAQPIEIDYNLTDGNFSSLEPAATADGRLFVARAGFMPIRNIDGTNNAGAKDLDIYYMVAPASSEPCDASAFSSMKRIQFAHKDPEMRDPATGKARYGIAEYPMRDSFGKLLSEKALFPIYPWIDRHGNNLFFSTGGSRLYNYDFSKGENFTERPVTEPERRGQVRDWIVIPNSERYPARCIKETPNCMDSPYGAETPDVVRGFSVLGSWTHGKTVVLDGLINASDYGLKRGLQFQRELNLYQPREGFDGWVRVGPGRDNSSSGSGINNGIESYQENSEIRGMSVLTGVVDSLENTLNAYRNMRPTLPRDVVWTMNNSLGSDEVVFDDYMDPKALIVSSMIAGAEMEDYGGRHNNWHYRDGFGWGGASNLPQKQNTAVLIQNAATSESLPVPSYGYLNKGRVEPVALGGIHGRGLWLEGSTLSYTFPKAIKNEPLFLTMFVDPRPENNKFKRLLLFPDGTAVRLMNDKIQVTKTFTADKSVQKKDFIEALPTGRWSQLGLSVSADGKNVSLYVNGMKKHRTQFKKKMFQLVPQTNNAAINLVVGVAAATKEAGFRGWIDDLKLFAYQPVPEVICNHAYGSLHYVKPEAGQYWKTLSNAYPRETHREILSGIPANFMSEKAIPADASVVCTTDYNDSMGIYRALLRENENLVSLRDALLFAVPKSGGGVDDGRLHWNAPRVDFQQSAFCLSCHSTEGRRGLSIAALTPGHQCSMNDLRRQPLQGPLYLSGLSTEIQLWSIATDHQTKPKLYSPSGALLLDPMVQPAKAGGSCD